MAHKISTNWVKIKLLVEQYGIPLREAKYLAALPDYKEAAGEWQRENDPSKLNSKPEYKSESAYSWLGKGIKRTLRCRHCKAEKITRAVHHSLRCCNTRMQEKPAYLMRWEEMDRGEEE